MSEKSETLTEAVRRLAAAEGAAQGGDLPAPEDLVAYRDGRLEGAAKESLERRLALNPEAAREYLDLADPSRLREPGREEILSDQEVRETFASLRERIRQESSEGFAQGPTHPAVLALPQRRIRGLRLGLWASSLAAVLIFAVAGIWISRLHRRLEERSGPMFAAVIDVHPVRGERPLSISSQAGEILLVFHDVHLGSDFQGDLEILDSAGRKIFSRRLQPSQDQDSLLYLSLPQALLPYGTYRIEIHGIRQGRRQLVQGYTLHLVPPDSHADR